MNAKIEVDCLACGESGVRVAIFCEECYSKTPGATAERWFSERSNAGDANNAKEELSSGEMEIDDIPNFVERAEVTSESISDEDMQTLVDRVIFLISERVGLSDEMKNASPLIVHPEAMKDYIHENFGVKIDVETLTKYYEDGEVRYGE
jgi:hypothetical protein